MSEFDSQRKSVSQTPALPNNLEAEQALLGALLFDNQVLGLMRELQPGHFYDPVHGRIFEAARARIRAGALADGVTLKTHFAQDDGLHSIGGAAYLMKLMTLAAPLNAQAAEYAEEIHELAIKRETFKTCQRLAHSVIAPDANVAEVIRQGERDLSALMAGGQSWVTVRQAGEEIVADLRHPAPRGIHTGLSKLDRLLGGGLYAPDLVVIAGRPAMGKTALADNIAANVAGDGKVVGFFSMEMDPPQIAARVLSRRSIGGHGFSYSSLRSKSDRPRADDVAPLLKSLPDTLLIDPTGAQTLAGIESSARNMKRQTRQLDMLIVDYLQLMRDASARKDGRTQEVSEITAGLKALAKRLQVPIVALSQLSRAVENRADKRPQLSDLRESGSIEQDADVVLFVYREHYYLERSTPTPEADEDRPSFSTRLAKHEQRKAECANIFDLISGKNRHASGGTETLYCDLAMDEIADERPPQTPHVPWRGQDGRP